ncbi:MAG: imidazolonepropionase [bacterium]
MSALLILNARLATPIASTTGRPIWQLREMFPAALYCEGGIIRRMGDEQTVLEELEPCDELDAQGRLLIPGFVDCHTHPVFFNHRAHEFVQRVQGKTYREIAAEGGGIRFSVRDLRSAEHDQLLLRVVQRLDKFLEYGTTTIEAKSGYGLSLEHELLSLNILQQASQQHPVEIVPTFLGAHEVPDEFRDRRSDYLALVIHEMLPQVAARKLARFADVFCEEHVFNAEESRRLLETAWQHGLRPKIHADQLSNSGGAEVAMQAGAVSADHLEHTPPALFPALRQTGVVPVLLPGADFFIGAQHYADARGMIAAGLPVAIATDFNPGTCMTENMAMIMTLACLSLRMSPAEALIAATLHAAYALGLGNQIGSLEVGKQADAVIFEAESVNEIPYHFGVNSVHTVIKRSEIVHQRLPGTI